MASAKAFTGKIIAISGAGSGLGLATAQYLAARGASLSLADVQAGPLQTAASDILRQNPGAKVKTSVVDVRNKSDVQNWIQTAVTELGLLDGAANFAGVASKGGSYKPVIELDDEVWDFVTSVNLTGTMYSMRAQLQNIREGGSIVNTSSYAGLVGIQGMAPYVASKHGVIGLTKTAAKEEGGRKVRVNCLCPGPIETPMLGNAAEVQRHVQINNALARRGDPEEVAALTAFLLGDESRFITGAAFSIDGAML